MRTGATGHTFCKIILHTNTHTNSDLTPAYETLQTAIEHVIEGGKEGYLNLNHAGSWHEVVCT